MTPTLEIVTSVTYLMDDVKLNRVETSGHDENVPLQIFVCAITISLWKKC